MSKEDKSFELLTALIDDFYDTAKERLDTLETIKDLAFELESEAKAKDQQLEWSVKSKQLLTEVQRRVKSLEKQLSQRDKGMAALASQIERLQNENNTLLLELAEWKKPIENGDEI
jgi:hypothetical protein